MKYLLVIFIFFSIISNGCIDDSISPYDNLGYIFPLNDGNKWYYTITGNEEDSIACIEIKSKTPHNNHIWYKIDTENLLSSLLNSTNWYRADKTGLYISEDTCCNGQIVFKQPTKEFERYSNSTYDVEYSSNHIIENSLGKFNCYKYQFDLIHFRPLLRYIYYCYPGIGIIKFETYVSEDSYFELTASYDLYETTLID